MRLATKDSIQCFLFFALADIVGAFSVARFSFRAVGFEHRDLIRSEAIHCDREAHIAHRYSRGLGANVGIEFSWKSSRFLLL